ncbi:hypothetical protein ABT112_04570 [Streptomyces sp. NPDC002055]|uniref:hypothetical protein n=1 Tax=Streptomyces sp. NPDC002055 TaxID=3154534 RepID=UPI00331AFFBD
MPRDDDVEQLARIRMQVTGETFVEALAALRGPSGTGSEGMDGTGEQDTAGAQDGPEPPSRDRPFRIVE